VKLLSEPAFGPGSRKNCPEVSVWKTQPSHATSKSVATAVELPSNCMLMLPDAAPERL